MNTSQTNGQPPNIFDQIRGQIDLGGVFSNPVTVSDVVSTPANQTPYGPSMSELLASKRTTSFWGDLWDDISNLWPFGSDEEPEPPKGPSTVVILLTLATVVGLVWWTSRRKT